MRNLALDEPLAQTVEHLTFNQGVPGSSPGRLTKNYEDFGRPTDHRPFARLVTGSVADLELPREHANGS